MSVLGLSTTPFASKTGLHQEEPQTLDLYQL
jgi:hypothetical protein